MLGREKDLNENEIVSAIQKARKGIGQYLAIMELFPAVAVSANPGFQRRYNAFYRVQRRPREWYEEYFSYMQRSKGSSVVFEDVLDHLYATLGRYEPSFSSKLAATLDPNQPVWDKFVLKNTKQTAPLYMAKNKIQRAKQVFQNIRDWYSDFMKSDEAQLIITAFNRLVEQNEKITEVKKIDFVLWQKRTSG